MNSPIDSREQFWRGRRVVLTGHTGFKGSWLAIWLNRLGAEVVGISLPPATSPSLYLSARVDSVCTSHFCDIRDVEALGAIVRRERPEIVFHLAAQPLVRASYRQPVETFATNIMGTAHLLDAFRGLDSVRAAVMVTTDKVYRNNEWCWPYREADVLGGHDPYSASKAACEIVIDSYRKAFLKEQGLAIASARAGNVIGGGDWSEDRLIPDAVRAWQAGDVLQIRRPSAIRPWQHVLEPLSGYMRLAEQLYASTALAGAYNFGPDADEAATVGAVVSLAREAYGCGAISFDSVDNGPHEAGWLALETAKARTVLGIRPRWTLEESVVKTMRWYKTQFEGRDAMQLCVEDITDFEMRS